MDRIKRSERVAAITRVLSREPGRLFTLREFVDMFGCAKSTLSEDITTVRAVFAQYGLGQIESVNGAAGGIRFYPFNDIESDRKFVNILCEELADKERLLEGDFLYTLDILSNPRYLTRMGEVFARRFSDAQPDVVVTVESMGVPIAMMVANALGKPFITARRDQRIWHGPAVTLNYMSASSRQVQNMSLPRRVLEPGKRALLIDDFMKGGGTARALSAMMEEFHVEVCGIGVIIARVDPPVKIIPSYSALIELGRVSKADNVVDVRPAEWLR